MYKPVSVHENETHIILCDFEVQTAREFNLMPDIKEKKKNL